MVTWIITIELHCDMESNDIGTTWWKYGAYLYVISEESGLVVTFMISTDEVKQCFFVFG